MSFLVVADALFVGALFTVLGALCAAGWQDAVRRDRQRLVRVPAVARR